MLQDTVIVVKIFHALVGQASAIALAGVLSIGGARGLKPLSDGNTSVSRDLILGLHEQPAKRQQQRTDQPFSCGSVPWGSPAPAGQDISLLAAAGRSEQKL